MLDKIEAAIEDIKSGKLVIVVDDEDRENEGDFVTSAKNVTPEIINFMSKYGRGLICMPVSEKRCDELQLDLMVNENTALHATPFTVSVDLLGHGYCLPVFLRMTVQKQCRQLLIVKPNLKILEGQAMYFLCGQKMAACWEEGRSYRSNHRYGKACGAWRCRCIG